MSEATEAELEKARKEGQESALADWRKGRCVWPMASGTGLHGKWRDIHLAWVGAKREKLEELAARDAKKS